MEKDLAGSTKELQSWSSQSFQGKMLRGGCLDASNSLKLTIQFEKINGDLVTWEVYEAKIYKRFGPCNEDPMEEIKNLRQNGIVLDYQDQFEALMFRPKSLYNAYQLARIQETVKAINKKRYTLILSTPNHPVNTAYINRSITYHAKSPTTQLALPSTPYTKPVNVVNTLQRKQLSQKEYEKKDLTICAFTKIKIVGAENRPPMLDKAMYNSWESCMLLYIKGKKNDRMMLKSIENEPLVYPTVEEDGQIQKKKSPTECIPRQTNVKSLKISGKESTKNMYTTNYDQLYAYLSQYEGHANVRMMHERYLDPLALVANYQILPNSAQYPQQLSSTSLKATMSSQPYSSNTKILFKTAGLLFNKFKGDRVRVLLGEGHMARQCTQPKRPMNAAWFKEKMLLAQAQESSQVLNEEKLAFLADPGITYCHDVQPTIIHNAAFQTDDLDAYDSDCDDISSEKLVLMANLSSYGSDILFEDSEYLYSLLNNICNRCKNTMFKILTLLHNKMFMIMSVFQQMSEQMSNHVTNWDKANQEIKIVNESLTDELGRYKEQVKTFEQRQNVDLSSHEKLIDSQMDDMIRNTCAFKQEIDSLKQTLSNQVKEKESLLQTFNVFKKESKDKENKYMNK
ncbi:hypothetical protein Tco_1103873 [Tanacetum coccineum]